MARKDTSGEESRRDFGLTELSVAVAGIGTAIGAFFLQLRKHVKPRLAQTGVYGDILDDLKKADKGLGTDINSPAFNREAYYEGLEANRAVAKPLIDEVHKKLGLIGYSPEVIKRKWKLVRTTPKGEIIKESLEYGFMAATLAVGLGITMELSKNRALKNQIENHLEEKESAPTPAKA